MTAVILIAVGLCLIIYSLMGMKKEKGTFSSIIQDEMTNQNKDNRQINILRKEVAESILDLQKDIFQLQEEINSIKKEGKVSLSEEDNKEHEYKKHEHKEHEEKEENNRRSIIINMLESGKTVDEISSSLGIGRGEILLIQDLNSK